MPASKKLTNDTNMVLKDSSRPILTSKKRLEPYDKLHNTDCVQQSVNQLKEGESTGLWQI